MPVRRLVSRSRHSWRTGRAIGTVTAIVVPGADVYPETGNGGYTSVHTGVPAGGGANRPQITGPGLAGPGFYRGACQR